MRWRLHISLGLLLPLLMLASCNTFKHVPAGEKLYSGAKLKLKGKGSHAVQYELEEVVSPKPNKVVLGVRFGLWVHFQAKKKPDSKLLKKLDKRYGEEPVYLSQVNAIKNEKILTNRLENRGYFGPRVSSHIIEKRQTGSVIYRVNVPEPYQVQTYTYLPDSTAIDSLHSVLKDSLIKKGAQFDTDLMKEERVRIDSYLKNKGFYHFNSDYLNFISDTNQYEDKRFDLYLAVKENTPPDAVDIHRINEISVFTDYNIDQSFTSSNDTSFLDDIVFWQGERQFKPKHLVDYIGIRKGDLFSQKQRIGTTRKLSSMGNFQYVSIRYSTDTIAGDSVGLLNASIQLTPYKKRSLQVELQGVTKSSNFAGPALIASYINRNLFRGGEILEIAGDFGYEFQIAEGSTKGLGSFQVKLSTGFVFPRLFPVKIKNKGGYSVPKTKLGLNGSVISRLEYYDLASFQIEYGFRWNSNKFISHELTPVDLVYSNVFRTTAEFDSILSNNTFLAQSFADQFIPGLTYTFLFNQLMEKNRKHRFFFRLTADIAGNVIGGIQTAAKTKTEIAGVPYAQYAKADIDVRHYMKVGRESQWINRLFVGGSIPYGNSSTLPYVKQYFSGGPNSIRAFRVRSLGPGSYDSSSTGTSFFDQSGDIKLEFNTEFRHPIYSLLKGAIFFDAGNVWLVNENTALPGGQFTKDWYRQIAMGFGYGLRLDIQFIVIRFDFATALRTANNTASENWTDAVGVWRGAGFSENVVVNFSIGYPF
ncbi:MAG: outer membrane protein insertion porin family [Granulosicoccus sp.]|jgi:outer membrane protein insertion porin family